MCQAARSVGLVRCWDRSKHGWPHTLAKQLLFWSQNLEEESSVVERHPNQLQLVIAVMDLLALLHAEFMFWIASQRACHTASDILTPSWKGKILHPRRRKPQVTLSNGIHPLAPESNKVPRTWWWHYYFSVTMNPKPQLFLTWYFQLLRVVHRARGPLELLQWYIPLPDFLGVTLHHGRTKSYTCFHACDKIVHRAHGFTLYF